jgi:hypothetical protein
VVDAPHIKLQTGKRARVIVDAVVLICLLIVIGLNTCLDGLPCSLHFWPIKNRLWILEPS